jgi:hypothetical protein
MLNRRKLIIVSSILLLVVVIVFTNILWDETWLSPEPVAIHVVINNRTDKQIGPFVISDHQNSTPMHIDKIAPSSAADVYYKKSEAGGENAIKMTDSIGKNYLVVPYFENQQKGRVDIRVECVGSDGLAGKKRDLISWYFSFEWRAWGAAKCE